MILRCSSTRRTYSDILMRISMQPWRWLIGLLCSIRVMQAAGIGQASSEIGLADPILHLSISRPSCAESARAIPILSDCYWHRLVF